MILSVPILAYVGALSSAIIVIIGLMRFRLFPTEMKVLWGFFLFSFLLNVLSFAFSFTMKNNLWLYHFNTLIEFCIFVFVFSFWKQSRVSTVILRFATFGFLLVWLMSKFFLEDFRQFDSFSSSFKSAVLVVIALYFLLSLYQRELWYKPMHDFRFWVLAAVLIYFSADVVFIALSNLISNLPAADVLRLWSLHWLIGILANILYAVAFLTKQPRALNSASSLRNL